ncbi:MAG TPA: porin family protein, partial [Chitinophagaceae bacterium]|nr:porin family protein [Chitinophagaceae bacterium]
MKKLTAVLLLVIIAYTGFSQGHFRVHAGPAFNQLNSGNTATSFDNIGVGTVAGVGYEMLLTNRFAIQPEFNAIWFKAKEAVSNAEYNFSYVQIPVLFKVLSNKQNIAFYGGPQLAFRTKANRKIGSTKTDVSTNVGDTEFGVAAGFEYITSKNIIFNFRFTQGLSNVFKVEFGSANTSRHQIISAMLGYRFGKKK